MAKLISPYLLCPSIQIVIYPTHEAELMNLKAAHPWDHRHYGGVEGGAAFVCVDRAEFAASPENLCGGSDSFVGKMGQK